MRKAGDILKVFLDRNTTEDAEYYHKFFTGWRHVVGERIAAHSEVRDIRNGLVIVEVDHPGWIQIIQLKQAQFVDVLRKKYPTLGIRGLKLQIPWKNQSRNARRPPSDDRDGGLHRRGEEHRDAGPAPTAEVEAQEAGEATPDPLIRSALSRLGKAIEQRAREE